MNVLSEEKTILLQEINKFELDEIKFLLSHSQYSFSDMMSAFSYSTITPITDLIYSNLEEKNNSKPKEEELIYSLQSLIKESFLFLLKHDEKFLNKCTKNDNGKIISAYIFTDNSISTQDLIFLYQKKLFSPEFLISHFLIEKVLLKENLNKKENKEYIEQLLKIDDIFNNNDYYCNIDRVLLKDNICDNLIENHYHDTISWNQILNSDINKFLKLTENDYKYFILNQPKNFERQFGHMQIKTLEKVLEHAPHFIGNNYEYLLEKITNSYNEENDIQSDDYYPFVHPDNLQFLIEKTPTSLDRKMTILKNLLKSLDNSIYWHNYREKTNDTFDFYTDGVKKAISDIEKKVIEQSFEKKENNVVMKKRI